ncbi:MAG TPA: hypothetical protein VHY82_11485 [Acetobacteraceae bacterium]|nr:hypothetical protein [Acetobacteraceae bacterium]
MASQALTLVDHQVVGDRIAFSPPLIITDAEMDDLAARLQRTLDDTWADVRTN